jgi:transposase
MARRRKLYGPEFKAEAVKLVAESGRPAKHVAAELGLPPTTLQKWVELSQQRAAVGSKLVETEREELARLRRENQQLKMEREILKKAAAFFAKENS